MSTKSTLHYQEEQFHLYEECFEESGDAYLELEQADFSVERINGNSRITVQIPLAVWNKIVELGPREAKKFEFRPIPINLGKTE